LQSFYYLGRHEASADLLAAGYRHHRREKSGDLTL
jgi:hypothetical protein